MQQLVTVDTRLWIFNTYKLSSTNNKLNRWNYAWNIKFPIIPH